MNFKKGFTLIELLVVIAIIAILIAIGFVSLGKARDKGADAAIKATASNFRSFAELYYSDKGYYGGYGAYGSAFPFACDSEPTCQWGESFVDQVTSPEGYRQFKSMTEEYAKDSWLSPNNHRLYFGNYGNSYVAVVRLRLGGYWCFDSSGYSGMVTAFPIFNNLTMVTASCPQS